MYEIKELTLNKQKSIEIYHKSKEIIHSDTCYANSRNVITQFFYDEFANGTYRIGYGYYTSIKNGGFVRHCFIVDNNNEVIDVTAVLLDSEEIFLKNENLIYICFAEMNTDEYMLAMEENDFREDLKKPLKDNECKIPTFFQKKNFHVMARDLLKYLHFEPEIKHDDPTTWTQEIKDRVDYFQQLIKESYGNQ